MKKKHQTGKIIILILLVGLLVTAVAEQEFEAIWIPIIMLLIIGGRMFFSKKSKKKNLPQLTSEKESHYRQAGLDEQEITFFRDTMATAKKQITQLETNMNAVSKLKAINLRHDTLIAAKAMFKELVKEPRKLHQADRFLYNHLPNLVDLTNKYLEIDAHELKNKETYAALEKSALVIDEVSVLLAHDYEQFVADDLADLEVEMTIAQQNLAREQAHKKATQKENRDDKV